MSNAQKCQVLEIGTGANRADRFHPTRDSIGMQVNERMAPGIQLLQSQGFKNDRAGGLATVRLLATIITFINMYTYVIFIRRFIHSGGK